MICNVKVNLAFRKYERKCKIERKAKVQLNLRVFDSCFFKIGFKNIKNIIVMFFENVYCYLNLIFNFYFLFYVFIIKKIRIKYVLCVFFFLFFEIKNTFHKL